jgi:hypothetical protein
MSERATCETCRWWDCGDSGGYSTPRTYGTCHIRSVPSDEFPERHETHWCGEHQPREVADE